MQLFVIDEYNYFFYIQNVSQIAVNGSNVYDGDINGCRRSGSFCLEPIVCELHVYPGDRLRLSVCRASLLHRLHTARLGEEWKSCRPSGFYPIEITYRLTPIVDVVSYPRLCYFDVDMINSLLLRYNNC